MEIILNNPSIKNPVSFFNRISVIDTKTGLRALPVFYTDNYFSIMPGEIKLIEVDIASIQDRSNLRIEIQGWNMETFNLEIK